MVEKDDEEGKEQRKNEDDYINLSLINIMPTTPRGQNTSPSIRTGSQEHRTHVVTNRQNRSNNTRNNTSNVLPEFTGLNLGTRQDTPGGRRRRRRSSKRRKPRKSKKKRRRRRKKRTKKKRRKSA